MKNPVCLGNITGHGGKVTAASPTFDLDGQLAVPLYDPVSCPEHCDDPIIGAGDDLFDGDRRAS